MLYTEHFKLCEVSLKGVFKGVGVGEAQQHVSQMTLAAI